MSYNFNRSETLLNARRSEIRYAERGCLSKVTDEHGYEKELFYDVLCRVTRSKERSAIGEDWDETKLEYNTSNQIDKKWLSDEAFMKYNYDKETGVVEKITFNDVAGNFSKVIFDSPTYNSMGKLTQYTLDIDNNISLVNAYDPTSDNYTGSSVYFGGISEANKMFGYGMTYYDDNNIHSRNVYMSGMDLNSQIVAMNTTEYFTYDKLSRLTYWGSTDVPYTDPNYAASKKINYDVLGQKLYNVNVNNSLIEDNNYDGEETDALSKSTYHPDVVKTEQSSQFPSQIITYNFYNKVSTITNTVGTTIRELSIGYRPNRSRYKTVYSENNTDLLTKYFYKGYEKTIDHSTNTEQKTYYIENGNGLAAIYIKKTGQSPAFYYVMKDHLGSIWALLDENGDFAERYAYDPWGNRKNPDDWSLADNRTDFIIDRGYTSHEHNDQLGMINTNGRYYDPLLGEFISPDPYVQSPTNSQNFNRYAYCLNNPLMYIDPDGEIYYIIPGVSWSKLEGFSASLSFGIGMPGGASVGLTFGYGSRANNFSASINGSLSGGYAYVGYDSKSGVVAGVGFGFGNPAYGVFSTNLMNVGVNYSQNGGLSGNFMGFSISEHNMVFNPSIGASTSIQISNYVDEYDGVGEVCLMSESCFKTEELALADIGSKGFKNGSHNIKYFKYEERNKEKPQVGGRAHYRTVTYSLSKRTFNYVYITMYPHTTYDSFYETFNHELIHAYDYNKYGYENTTKSYRETKAYQYSDRFKSRSTLPSDIPVYKGNLDLFDLPNYLVPTAWPELTPKPSYYMPRVLWR